jgi:hypothetical protein
MSVRNDIVQWFRVMKGLPVSQPDTTEMPMRGTRYGEAIVQNVVSTKQSLADEGTYFVCTNPTPGTPIAYGAAPPQSFADTTPFIQIINTATPGDPNARRVFVDYMKFIQIGGPVPGSSTSVGAALKLDQGYRTPSSGTYTIQVPVCTNMDLATAQPCARVITPYGAVNTIPAASSAARLIGRAMLKGGPTLLLDEYSIAFGLNDVPGSGGYSTTVAAYTTRMPAFALGPGQSATLHMWMPAAITNPYSYEFEIGLWER